MVKEHVLAVLGPASMAFSNTMIKMSKLQAAQVRCGAVGVHKGALPVASGLGFWQAEGALAELPGQEGHPPDRSPPC